MVTVELVTGQYRVGEEATSLSIGMLKEGETEVDVSVILSTMSLTADGMGLNVLIVIL